MSHVVCLLNVEADSAQFTWCEGPASFEPYKLDRMGYEDFKDAAELARRKLADLVKDYMFDESNVPQASYELAAAGHELYQAMFDADAGQAQRARQVRNWLAQLAEQQQVDTLEIVVESPWALPWNLVYDQRPDKSAFLAEDGNLDCWRPFWGLRYDLAAGRKVDPLRRMPLLENPRVLMVVDPEIRDGLPPEQQQRLDAFAEHRGLTLVHNKDALQQAIREQRPDLLYWLSHADADALILDHEPISPRNMRKLLRPDDGESFGGLAFLNACQTAEAGEAGSFFDAFHSVGFAGMIGTEHQTVDQFANPLGLDFLEDFLDRGAAVGSALRKLRGRVPLGLLYGAYCPPDIRVNSGGPQDEIEIRRVQVAGVALGSGAAAPARAAPTGRAASSSEDLPPLPPEPYRSLAYYDRADRALFAGRDDDIQRFAVMLDDAATRILVLHGESGVGKSSFLHAGVIPFLEEECLGYRFIRQSSAGSAGRGAVMFVRATNDLFSQLAQAVCGFCQQPYAYETPLGDRVSADLPDVLRAATGDRARPAALREALIDDPALLGRVLAAIGDCLPFTSILVVDQGEELFTLTQSPEDRRRSRQALDMLRRTVGASGDFKVIFSLRTEYYGRLIDRLRRGLHDAGGIREYLLTDFDAESLVEAIRRPTLDHPIPFAAEIPWEKYGFRYADGVAEDLADRVIRHSTIKRDSVLPLVQIICAQLYAAARERDDPLIDAADVETIGGVEGGLRKHVDALLIQVATNKPSEQRAFKQLVTQLYLRQADGSLTTALLAEDELAARWRGRAPFAQVLQRAAETRLLRISTLRDQGAKERRYVSLGHDALAKLAAEWDDQLQRRERFRRRLKKAGLWAAGVFVVLLALGYFGAQMDRGKPDNVRDQLRLHPAIVEHLGRIDDIVLSWDWPPELQQSLPQDSTAEYFDGTAVEIYELSGPQGTAHVAVDFEDKNPIRWARLLLPSGEQIQLKGEDSAGRRP